MSFTASAKRYKKCKTTTGKSHILHNLLKLVSLTLSKDARTRAWISDRWSLHQGGHAGIVSRGVDCFLSPNGGELPSCYTVKECTPCAFHSRFEETIMRLKRTNSLRCLLALCLMSGLVACGSLMSCFNNGFASVDCGGGYDDRDFSSLPQPTATSAEGCWTGATPTSRTIGGLVLEDGSYWVFYTARDSPNVLAGLVQGTGTSHSGSFGSSNTRDFNLEGAGILAATISGSYVPKESFRGTVAYFNGDTESFTSTYDADYESIGNMNLVAGTYSGLRADNHTVTERVDSAGALSGHSSDGCTFAGTLSPRTKGNVFHHAMTFGGGTCRHGTETVAGTAFYDAATNRLYSAALNHARTNSFIFIGTKQ